MTQSHDCMAGQIFETGSIGGNTKHMWLSEQILYRLAKLMSSSEAGQSDEMKSALKSDESYAEYRLGLIAQVTDAAERFGVPVKDQVVLDLGCSDGAISTGYLEYGAKRVIGVDIDEKAIAIAKEQRTREGIEFHAGTIDRIPIPDNSVQTILCYDVFEHVEKPAEILGEISRVLKPGGKMLIGTWGWKHPFAPHLWSTMPVPWAHMFFSERTVLRTCRRVYHSDWYSPNMHDFDENGNRYEDKYTHESIPTDYLNKYLVKDFERVFKNSALDFEMHPQPFGSKYAAWSRIFLNVPWIREFVTGYLWVVLTKPERTTAPNDTLHSEPNRETAPA